MIKSIEKELQNKIWTEDSMSRAARIDNAWSLACKYTLELQKQTDPTEKRITRERLNILANLYDSVRGFGKYLETGLPTVEESHRRIWKERRIVEYVERARRTDSRAERNRLEEATSRLYRYLDR